jgi:hypothetical protein
MSTPIVEIIDELKNLFIEVPAIQFRSREELSLGRLSIGAV